MGPGSNFTGVLTTPATAALLDGHLGMSLETRGFPIAPGLTLAALLARSGSALQKLMNHMEMLNEYPITNGFDANVLSRILCKAFELLIHFLLLDCDLLK
jgi:hypothetical protein